MFNRSRRICQIKIQEFWFQECDIKEVLSAYDINKGDACHDSVVKLLLKTRKDFINGFSFFTRESIDDKIVRLMQKHGHHCMNH